MPTGRTSVDQEAELLKAALREAFEQPTGPARGVRADPSHEHDGASPEGDRCPVCRASRAIHDVAPELLEEAGRGLTAAGRLLQELASSARRHTAEHQTHRTEREAP